MILLSVTHLTVNILFDRDDDTFVLTVGDPQDAIAESINNYLYLRVDPDSLKIVGIEIPHVSRRLNDQPLLAEMLRRTLPLAAEEARPGHGCAQGADRSVGDWSAARNLGRQSMIGLPEAWGSTIKGGAETSLIILASFFS